MIGRAGKITARTCTREQSTPTIYECGANTEPSHQLESQPEQAAGELQESKTCKGSVGYTIFVFFQYIISCQVYIILSLASLVPISSHYYINHSPLSSTVRDMTILKELHISPYEMPAPSYIRFL